jgi:hypothetical protein
MKNSLVAGAFVAVLAGAALAAPPDSAPSAGASSASAGDRELGLGVILGDPIGGTAKLWFDENFAVDAGAGFASAENRAAFWGDALWHDWTVLPQPKSGKLGGYVGVGPELETGDDARFGIRTVVGLSYKTDGHPIEFFAEAGPLFRLTQGGAVDAVGGVGMRFLVPSR